MRLQSARMAPQAFLDSSTGPGVTCGWGDAGTREDPLSKSSRQLIAFFQSPSAGQERDRGLLSTASSKPSSANIIQAGKTGGCVQKRGTWAGSAPDSGGGEPRLPSRLTAQLVPSNSCQPVVSQPGSVCAHRRAASGPSSPNGSGRRSAPRPASS